MALAWPQIEGHGGRVDAEMWDSGHVSSVRDAMIETTGSALSGPERALNSLSIILIDRLFEKNSEAMRRACQGKNLRGLQSFRIAKEMRPYLLKGHERPLTQVK